MFSWLFANKDVQDSSSKISYVETYDKIFKAPRIAQLENQRDRLNETIAAQCNDIVNSTRVSQFYKAEILKDGAKFIIVGVKCADYAFKFINQTGAVYKFITDSDFMMLESFPKETLLIITGITESSNGHADHQCRSMNCIIESTDTSWPIHISREDRNRFSKLVDKAKKLGINDFRIMCSMVGCDNYCPIR